MRLLNAHPFSSSSSDKTRREKGRPTFTFIKHQAASSMEPRYPYPYPPKHRRPFPVPPPHDEDLNSTSSPSSSDQHLPHQPHSSPEILLKRRRLHPYDQPHQYNPRAAAPAAPVEWSKQSTFALIDAWGHRFLSNGRRNLHSHQWSQVLRLLNDVAGTSYSEHDCRNRIDVLKNRYDNEKARLFPSASTATSASKWPYFTKLHQFLGPDPSQRKRERERDMPKLTFGMDNGHFVSGQGPPDIASEGDDDYDDDAAAASDAMHDEAINGNGLSSYGVLAHSVKKFSEVCQRMETNRKRQAQELETLRRDFQMELQSRKREIFKRVQNELAKVEDRYDDGMRGEGMDDEDGDDDMDDDDDGDGQFGGNLSD